MMIIISMHVCVIRYIAHVVCIIEREKNNVENKINALHSWIICGFVWLSFLQIYNAQTNNREGGVVVLVTVTDYIITVGCEEES